MLFLHDIISHDHCGMLSHGMLSFSNETFMLYNSNNWDLFFNLIIYWLWGHLWKPITSSRVSSAPCLLHSLSIGFEVVHENHSQAPAYLQPHVSYILSNINSLCRQLKVLSNESKITNFVFPYIISSIECISKFFNACRKHLKLSDLSSSLNVKCCLLWFESFGNFCIMLLF